LRKLVTILLLCLVLFATFTDFCAATDENEVLSKINDAENALQNAFSAVQEAEKLDVDVSSLVNDLSVAGGLLDEAEIAYTNGDLDAAIQKADQSLATANKVLGDAASFSVSASADALNVFWPTLIFSTVGAVLFIVVLILVWRLFSRLYIKKLLKMKAEVT
jgi:hypothetical protein